MSQNKQLRRVDWLRALRAIRVMRADPNRSDQVSELNVALDGGDNERLFQTFLAEAGSAALLRSRPALIDALADWCQLRRLPARSLGAAYLRLMEDTGLDPDGLRKAFERIGEYAELHPGEERTWLAHRNACVHDLLHVVTGYGQDVAGETALLAFNDGLYCQHFRFRVVRFGMMASLLSAPARSLPRALAFAWRARRRGARARIPFSFRWEEQLGRPLDAVRHELQVAPVSRAHPRAILHGTIEATWQYGPAPC